MSSSRLRRARTYTFRTCVIYFPSESPPPTSEQLRAPLSLQERHLSHLQRMDVTKEDMKGKRKGRKKEKREGRYEGKDRGKGGMKGKR